MTRPQKHPLRSLTPEEQKALEKVSRSQRESASRVTRAKLLLAVAAGSNYSEAARGVGRRSGDAVAQLVNRFNHEGLVALDCRHGGGPRVVYGREERAKVLAVVQHPPDCLADGTTTWSLSTLQRHLRDHEPTFAQVSTYTLHHTLKAAGWSWQKTRSWCETGSVLRKRKTGVVTVMDPDAEAKKP